MKKRVDIWDKFKIVNAALFKVKKPMVAIACQVCNSKNLGFMLVLNTGTVCDSEYVCRNCGARAKSHETWVRGNDDEKRK